MYCNKLIATPKNMASDQIHPHDKENALCPRGTGDNDSVTFVDSAFSQYSNSLNPSQICTTMHRNLSLLIPLNIVPF